MSDTATAEERVGDISLLSCGVELKILHSVSMLTHNWGKGLHYCLMEVGVLDPTRPPMVVPWLWRVKGPPYCFPHDHPWNHGRHGKWGKSWLSTRPPLTPPQQGGWGMTPLQWDGCGPPRYWRVGVEVQVPDMVSTDIMERGPTLLANEDESPGLQLGFLWQFSNSNALCFSIAWQEWNSWFPT